MTMSRLKRKSVRVEICIVPPHRLPTAERLIGAISDDYKLRVPIRQMTLRQGPAPSESSRQSALLPRVATNARCARRSSAVTPAGKVTGPAS